MNFCWPVKNGWQALQMSTRSSGLVERVVNVILGRMTETLSDGGRVELRGFGAFSVRSRPARTGRNPRTGETVEVPAKAVPFFKSGKELRERLNASGDA